LGSTGLRSYRPLGVICIDWVQSMATTEA